MGRGLLSDFDGTLIVGLEEVIGAVVLDGLSAVFSHVEHYNTHTHTQRKRETNMRDVLKVET